MTGMQTRTIQLGVDTRNAQTVFSALPDARHVPHELHDCIRAMAVIESELAGMQANLDKLPDILTSVDGTDARWPRADVADFVRVLRRSLQQRCTIQAEWHLRATGQRLTLKKPQTNTFQDDKR